LVDGADHRPPAIAARDDVEIRLGAKAVHLPVVRAVAVNIAMRADLDLDAISDLELAVDEACSSLIVLAEPNSILICRFTVGDEEIVFRASVDSTQQAPSTGTFGWRVLTTLTDRARSWSDSGQVHIEVAKATPVAHADRREEIR
jgi:serine/threonine-protein kinase RsbW